MFELLLIAVLVDASDAKGEPIHQTLMAKKMQRLDESPDFRPFKFRIQAFTNAFLEEVCPQRDLFWESRCTKVYGLVACASGLSRRKDSHEEDS